MAVSKYEPNQDFCIGKIGKIEEIDVFTNELRVSIEGRSWPAEINKAHKLSVGDKVKVLDRDRLTLFVEPLFVSQTSNLPVSKKNWINEICEAFFGFWRSLA